MNSRPLTAQSEDEIVKVLRPIDFLLPQGAGLTINETIDIDPADPEFFLPKEKEAKELIRLHQRALHRVQIFWKTWLDEYLISLKERCEELNNQ